MPGATIRISPETHALLRELAAGEQLTMQAVLRKAVESYRRQQFLEQANAAFAALRKDPEAWREEVEERKRWEQTLLDGLVAE